VQRQALLETLAAHLKLTWIYDEPSAASEAPLIPPPPEELKRVQQLVNEGRIFDIQAQAVRLEALDEAYVPFAHRLGQLTKGFEIEQIEELIRQMMEAHKDEQR
jgi:hypothetical protein